MNTAQVIPFKKPPQPKQEAGKSMYSDKFAQGYVMSSCLYRKEVRPFLTDAAHNVYERLEDWINGQLKETDHVSHRQIQGGVLKGSNKLSSATVSSGLKELIWFGVITVVEKNNRIGNKYQINEVSLAGYFEQFSASVIKALRISNESTSITEALQLVKHQSISNESASASGSGASIDNKSSLDNKDNTAPEKFEPQNRSMLQFIEYHADNQKSFTLRELTQVYPVQSDFIAQAKVSFPKLTDDQIQYEIRKLAQWSITAGKRQSQKWMTTWLNWLKNFENDQSKPKPAAKPNQPKAEKPQRSSRFGQYLKNNNQQPQQMRDIRGEDHDV